MRNSNSKSHQAKVTTPIAASLPTNHFTTSRLAALNVLPEAESTSTPVEMGTIISRPFLWRDWLSEENENQPSH